MVVMGKDGTILMPRFLQWPANGAAAGAVRASFEAGSGVPGVVGAMYTTHVPIIAPKVSVSAYFNRRHTERNQKTSYSITLQGDVGPDGGFTDVCIGWPGSMSDDQVLNKFVLTARIRRLPTRWSMVAGLNQHTSSLLVLSEDDSLCQRDVCLDWICLYELILVVSICLYELIFSGVDLLGSM
jgi:hypothetical protein